MKEIVLISSVVVSALLFFLVYKTMKNETYFKNEITRLNRQVNEINSSVLLKEKNNLISASENGEQVSTENTDSNGANESNLASEYNTYCETNFGNQNQHTEEPILDNELSSELKSKINQLENNQETNTYVEYNSYVNTVGDLEESVEVLESVEGLDSVEGLESVEDFGVVSGENNIFSN